MLYARAVVYDFMQDAAEYLNALSTGQTLKVTESTFDYFLNVLPPVYMGRTSVIDGQSRRVAFGFAEGRERITAFWREKRDAHTHYFFKLTDGLNRL